MSSSWDGAHPRAMSCRPAGCGATRQSTAAETLLHARRGIARRVERCWQWAKGRCARRTGAAFPSTSSVLWDDVWEESPGRGGLGTPPGKPVRPHPGADPGLRRRRRMGLHPGVPSPRARSMRFIRHHSHMCERILPRPPNPLAPFKWTRRWRGSYTRG